MVKRITIAKRKSYNTVNRARTEICFGGFYKGLSHLALPSWISKERNNALPGTLLILFFGPFDTVMHKTEDFPAFLGNQKLKRGGHGILDQDFHQRGPILVRAGMAMRNVLDLAVIKMGVSHICYVGSNKSGGG